MHKERLFKYIRNEDVVIWAGAGFSLYAGYPSGQGLVDLIYNDLTSEEKKIISPNLSLQSLTEELIRIRKSKNSLNALLEKIFYTFSPVTTEYHDKLVEIPHIKAIITTNYDSLFENAYKSKSNIIRTSEDLTYRKKNKVDIIKIHGDFNSRDKIVISQSDYNDFFKNDVQANLIWTHIKNLIATKNILFLGYGYEDPNISVVFEKILDELGNHRKEIFFIAPNQDEHKIDYLKSKNIHYIDMNGETLIDELIEVIKENIVEDFNDNLNTPDTLNNFLSQYNLAADLKGGNDGYKLKSITGKDGFIEGKMDLIFRKSNDFEGFNEIITGKMFGEFELTDKNLIAAKLTSQGVKIYDSKEFIKVKFRSKPKYEIKVDFRFDDDYEVFDVDVKVYVSLHKIEIQIQFDSADIILSANELKYIDGPAKINFKYNHNPICKKVNDEIIFYNFLKRLVSGQNVTFFLPNGDNYTKSLTSFPNLESEYEGLLSYFTGLQLIEKKFGLKFKDISINDINDESFDNVHALVQLINNDCIVSFEDNEIKLSAKDYNDEQFEQLEKINSNISDVCINLKNEQVVSLHCQDIFLGYKKIIFSDLEIFNYEDVITKKSLEVKIRSKKMISLFSKMAHKNEINEIVFNEK